MLAPRPVVSLLAMLATVVGLGLPVVATAPAQAKRADPEFASYAKTFRGDGTLRKGCHNYRFGYKIDPPDGAEDSWGLELFLVDRRGHEIASGGVLSGADPKKGHSRVRFCRASTVPGKFKLRGKFTYIDGYDTQDGHIQTTRFRLRRP